MKKEQEAWDTIKKNVRYSLYELNQKSKVNPTSKLIKSINMIDEVVDKATPKVPIHYEKKCPNCRSYAIHKEDYEELHKYCPDCGQAIKRSEQ